MARPRTHHEEKKQELIKIAFELFMKNGYENTSIQDIMNAAQISKGAMYHYFICKEDVLDAVLNFIIDQDVKRLEPVFNNTSLSAMEKLIAAMSCGNVQTTGEIQQATEYILKRRDSIFDYRARELSKNRTIPKLADLIREGVASGEFRTDFPEEMASFIFASSQSLSEMIMNQVGGPDFQRAVDAFVQLLTHCLGLEKSEQNFLSDFFKEQFEMALD